MGELLPCPFCGEDGRIERHGGGPMSTSLDWFCVCCTGCEAHTWGGGTPELAVAAWNHRPALEQRHGE